MKIRICVLFILIASSILAQESSKTRLKGKINANTIDLEGVYVINLKTEKSTITDKDGFFSITAISGDTLLFSAVNLKRIQVCLEQNDFQKDLFLVKMESMITYLNEIVVRRYDNINAFSLGIVSKGKKSYTPAERKLYAANSLNATASNDGMSGGSISVDPLLNWMSGRTKMLKNELEVENKELCMQQLENMFDKNMFVNGLKIPLEYVKGFEYYIVENDRFTALLKSKNKTNIEFAMITLAEKYIEIIACENE
ncbi:hypothetical protein [Flavobacterium soyangense]|uniref:CarboxypepD_reg-like domain-containing protein n=1 Tax=Flavobacterium soyangense TaxID=2023265 RepID=A0A930Y204_9FLAO|nr:hypothetical protein [Flavobacterium soyangense]MBF2710014.1 hypothetical protein [Flavobacterium soyangense]